MADPGERADLSGEEGRLKLWLPLLRRLDARFPSWIVWKNSGSALYGHGDIDSLADPADFPAIEAEFRRWAAEAGMDHVIVCRHIVQGPHLIAFRPGMRHLVQLDVKERATFRGSTLIDWRQAGQLGRRDALGFRSLRPGAEGVIKLLSNGVLPGGRRNPEGLRRKDVAALLASDPVGTDGMARLWGPFGFAVRRAVRAVVEGRWSRPAVALVEAWSLLRALAEPRTLFSRVRFKYWGRARCPVIRTIRRDDRRIPDDLDAWLREVRRTHPAVSAPPAAEPALPAHSGAGR